MPYTTQVIEKGTSYSFIAEAKPPTVTMPRIKALMTGSIPGFIDVVVNLNSPALMSDNLIWQAKAAGKRIIFYGDDTWVKLFPKHFVEYDGTTSFFVSDFTEVDDNVTRHLDRVLKREDWDLLILHYLGLDHIGHMTGPNSPLVGPKLREMDNVLKKIHISLLSKEGEASLPSLLVVCGDHGMSETGSHGGSSEGEVHTPLLFISSAFEKRSGPLTQLELVQQTDLASTLAVGLGLPISRNNVGNIILPVVGSQTMREQLRFLHMNGFQLSTLLQENTPAYEKGNKTLIARSNCTCTGGIFRSIMQHDIILCNLNTGQIFVGKDRKEANKADILVRVCYRPSSKDKEGDEAVYKQLAEVMQSLSLVPVGDFNLPDLCCKCSTAQKNSRRCLDCVEDNFLAQLEHLWKRMDPPPPKKPRLLESSSEPEPMDVDPPESDVEPMQVDPPSSGPGKQYNPMLAWRRHYIHWRYSRGSRFPSRC
ncbi:GPI ethanolamine phosphate transferase 2 [Meleagris gallopavo]|uniref:GPI ethanolamine phosphate transferase 2 n=1 Tax=Meleagris gallopavo TaxID=9103 RepID=UPI0012ABDE85|nr:GPI ethanolamine phosphate transferase 2 [Meleagris gallopavo]